MQRTITTILAAIGALAMLTSAAVAAPPLHAQVNHTLAQVRAATAQYHDVGAAIAAGYELGSPCIPEMGFHYVREPAAGQAELDPTEPQILVYAPHPNGELQLVAVEYASLTPATLFGVEFDDTTEALGSYTLHTWVWKHNPDGMFAAHNPRVTSCPPLEMPH